MRRKKQFVFWGLQQSQAKGWHWYKWVRVRHGLGWFGCTDSAGNVHICSIPTVRSNIKGKWTSCPLYLNDLNWNGDGDKEPGMAISMDIWFASALSFLPPPAVIVTLKSSENENIYTNINTKTNTKWPDQEWEQYAMFRKFICRKKGNPDAGMYVRANCSHGVPSIQVRLTLVWAPPFLIDAISTWPEMELWQEYAR